MHGSADAPVSAESKDFVEVLGRQGVQFVALDVNKRGDLLAVIGHTVPALYVGGQFIADLSKLKEMETEGKLKEVIPPENIKETLESRLKRLINQKKVMLFMKGSPSQGACGFSQKIVNLLANYDGLEYGHFDIFKDEEVREGLKKYSKWPTYPQLYVDGTLIGGIDICQELQESGELEDVLFGK